MHILLGGSLSNPYAFGAYLEVRSHFVHVCHTAEDILDTIAVYPDIEVLVVGVSFPDMLPLTFLRNIRKHNAAPVIMVQHSVLELTSSQRTVLLEEGLSSMLVAPAHAEIMAQIHATVNLVSGATSQRLVVGDLTLCTTSKRAWIGDMEPFHLPRRELDILEVLVRRVDKRVTKETIFSHVYNDNDDYAANIVEVHISKMRSKLHQRSQQVRIDNRRFLGYLLTANPEHLSLA